MTHNSFSTIPTQQLHASYVVPKNRLRIIPTRYGLYCGALILAGFAMGYQIQNNFVLFAVLLLVIAYIFALFVAVRNVEALTITAQVEPYYFVNTSKTITLEINRTHPAYNLILMIGSTICVLGSTSSHLECGVLKPSKIKIELHDFPRGIHRLPRFKIETRFPFGITRTWVWIELPLDLVIAPAFDMTAHKESEYLDAGFGDDVPDDYDLRPHMASDGLTRIEWKRYAASRRLMVRHPIKSTQNVMCLTAPAHFEREEALTWLCGGLRYAQENHHRVRMWFDAQSYLFVQNGDFAMGFHVLARA